MGRVRDESTSVFPRLACIECPDDEMLELVEDKMEYKSLFECCVGCYVE